MGDVTKPLKVKLIVGFLFTDAGLLQKTKDKMAMHFGKVDMESPVFSFDFTTYYNPEMGEAIQRQYVSFAKLVHPADLVNIKRYTNDLEIKLSGGTKRKINIDPGYVDLSKMVLATTKDATYRTYLSYGIYAQSTLFFMNKSFRSWEWTYADYKSDYSIDFFNVVRQGYKTQVDHGQAKPKGMHVTYCGIMQSKIAILLLLFFALGPFAIPLLWKSLKFSRFQKMMLTILVAIETTYISVDLILFFIKFGDLIKRLFITFSQMQ